jgi:uncharacterized RDD family membrane protein YckC
MSATQVQGGGMLRRTLALIVDTILLGVLFVVMSALSGGSHTGKGFSVQLNGLPALLYYVICFLYFIVLEWLLGATLGKLVLGLRVVGSDGSKISLGQSLGRNLLRIVDGFPYFIPYLLGFIVAMTGPTRQRVGDRAASTIVK